MAKSLREAIAEMKAKNSPQSNQAVPQVAKPIGRPKTETPMEVPVPSDTEVEEYTDEELDSEIPAKSEKAPVMSKEQGIEVSKEQISKEQQIYMEIEMLQNNGRYRAELLHQLQEINRALAVIAGVLVDLTGEKK